MTINAERLRKLIDQTGLTDKEVAKLIGKSHSCISVILKNGSTSAKTLGDLCKVLRVTPDVLTALPEEKPKEDTQTVMASIHLLHKKIDGLDTKLTELIDALAALKNVWE